MSFFSTKNTAGGIHLLTKKDKIDTRDMSLIRSNSRSKVPDEHVLDMRRKHELESYSQRQVERAYPQYSESYIRNILAYTYRTHLRVR